ncbi:TSSK6-activating co-chaperone protein isoform X2 [Alligator mississippiensis]|uniref:TSSK6-activating co-chaperone protein isoform X2 n=1 Tax=Alligator mississippiensis TaxID=8496 RepID=UPI000711863D|nr:TSSK6-activating co-chaperone protein isoform X2 [Alligator mississippiensis]
MEVTSPFLKRGRQVWNNQMWGKLKVWPDSQRDRTNSWRKGASVVASFVPTQIEADSSTQEERQHGIKDSENVEHPSASFKLFHPAKPSPSFLELPFTQRRPSRGHRCIQAVRLGHKQFSPDHQPQECMGLLECMHNHLQIQTKMVQAQFSLLEGLQESLSLLQATSERRGRQQDNSETGHQGLTSASK